MTSETTKQPDRAKLEAAVGKVARAYHDLVRLIEGSSSVEETDIAKTFNFLATVQSDSRSKAELSLRTALAANGGFSLDKEYQAPAARPAAPPVRERLVGQGKPKPALVAADEDVDFVDS